MSTPADATQMAAGWDEGLLREVGARVRAARVARGWNQDEYADQAGVHRSYVGQIENGKKDLRLSTLYRLAGALGISVHDLLPAGVDATSP